MNCFLRSYNAKRAERFGKKPSIAQNLILVCSNPLSHTEFQFSSRYNDISFSATLEDGDGGCRFKDIVYSDHPERWDTIELPFTDEEEDRAHNRALELEGKEYDLIGLLSIPTGNVIKEDADKYWCSETVAELVKRAYSMRWPEYDIDFIPSSFTPVTLFFEMLYRLNKAK